MRHITLTTGHSRESPRADVADDILPVVGDLLTRSLAGESVPVPWTPDLCTIRASAAESALLVTVYAEGGKRVPLVTMGVCAREPDSALLWRLLHESAVGTPITTDPARPPAVPWCGVRIEVGLLLHPQPAEWLGDFERCLSWWWIEHQESRP